MTTSQPELGPCRIADAEGSVPPGPAVRRHKLGMHLRQLRQQRSLRLEEVAESLGVSPSTLSRIETGQAPTRTSYLAVMLNLYGVEDETQRRLLTDMAREGQRKAWWAEYDELLPPGVDGYLRLEATASHVWCYSPQVVPDLLQTADYAAAVIRASRPDLNGQQVSKLVALLLRRQEHPQHGSLRLHAVIDESVLSRPIAPARVWTDQLERLLAVSTRPSVTIQVTTQTAEAPMLSPPFTLLSFTGPADPAVACCHGPGGQVITSRRRTDVCVMDATFNIFSAIAMSPASTVQLISNLIR